MDNDRYASEITTFNLYIIREHICSALPQVKKLDGQQSSSHKPIKLQADIQRMCSNAFDEFCKLEKQYHNVVRYVKIPRFLL